MDRELLNLLKSVAHGSNEVTLVTEKVHPQATSLELTAWR
jgi:hypothetical protein